MEFILLGFCVILLTLYGSKAYRMHKGYAQELSSALFPSYLEYFFRNAIRHDCSTSSLLKSKLGTHRIAYAVLQNSEHQVTSRFVILFYNKGIACIRYLDPKGMLKGKEADKHWTIQREEKLYRIQNPMLECKKYSSYLQKKVPNIHIEEYISCTNDTNITKVNAPIFHYDKLLDTLKARNLPYISEEAIVKSYETFNQKEA